MANAIYSANLSNLKKIFQNIQDNPAINDINVELTFGPNEDGTFPLIYARFDISDLTKLETDLSPGTDSVHQQFCKNSGKLIKRKKKSLDAFFKNHGLIPFLIDSFSEQGSFILVYAQNPRIHDYWWIFDQEERLYFPRDHLMVDQGVRDAAHKSGFKPTSDDRCKLILTKELYESLENNNFLTYLQPFFPDHTPIIPTFDQYQRFWSWSKTNYPQFFNSFVNIKELVKYDGSYKLAYSTNDKSELEEILFTSNSPVYSEKIRIAEVKK